MSPQQLHTCLDHLEAAEELMVQTNDFAGLTRLSLVIEMLRRKHGLPDRPIDLNDFALGPITRLQGSPQ